MHIAIRVDGSQKIGTGHVMRCTVLAEALAERGARVSFISRSDDVGLTEAVQQRGFQVLALAQEADWEEDAEQTRAAIVKFPHAPDWLIVDHYALDARWEKTLRSAVRRIFVIDDLADREHDCDLLLDQNLVGDMYRRYDGKVPQRCALMLGPRYALLQPIYADLHDRIGPREGAIRRIMMFFGGTTGEEVLSVALGAFLRLNRSDVELDVVLPRTARMSVVQTEIQGRSNVHVHQDLPSLAPLMARADLAIGAVGSTTWERMCLGLPSLAITLADNQIASAKMLHRLGMLHWLGNREEVDADRMGAVLREQLNRGSDTKMSQTCRQAVDGNGVERVLAALLLDSNATLICRDANLADEFLLLDWANDPCARGNSFTKTLIGTAEHHEWFSSKLRDLENARIFMVETRDGTAVACVRFEREQTDWRVSYSVGPPYRGKGLGHRALELGIGKLRKTEARPSIVGRVTESNLPSQRIFQRLGFAQTVGAKGQLEYRLKIQTEDEACK